MTKITTDFVGSETIAVTKQRLTDILAYWGASTAAYTTWGQARTALNALLTSTTAGTIGSTELAGTFLPKINFLNDPDEMIADALFGAGEQGVWLDPSDVANVAWRRNLLLYTEQFEVAAGWATSGATVTANAAAAPDGTTTADKLIPDTTSNAHYIGTSGAGSTLTHTISVYAKADGYQYFQIMSAVNAGQYANFDLTAGTVSATGGDAVSAISPLSGGWYRCSITVPSLSITTLRFLVVASGTSGWNSSGLLGNGTSGILIWGAQLELGTVATEYQRITDLNTEVIERFPNATMYQDAAGTVPVYAPGQPVGLRLDKSKGLVLGSELVTNGDFSGGSTGWVVGAGWAVAGGAAAFTTGSSGGLFQSTTLSASKRYRVTFEKTGTGSCQIRFGTGGQVQATISGQGLISAIIQPDSTSFIGFYGDNAGSFTIDNVSVKELAGNHATQSTAGSRPMYGIEPKGGRRNLLEQTETFDNVYWLKQDVGVTANAAVAPNGTMTADKIIPTAVSTTHAFYRLSIVSSQTCTMSFYLKSAGYDTAEVLDGTNGTNGALFNSSTGAVTNKGTGVGSMSSVGDGWYRCVVTVVTTGMRFYVPTSAGNFTGDGTSGVLVWGAQIELGSSATPYQRVTTAFDVTEAGVNTCHYCQYDGSDDGMVTNSIDFTATDKMSVFAGVRKLSDAAYPTVVELSSNSDTLDGSFLLSSSRSSTLSDYYFQSRGTLVSATLVTGSIPAPSSNVIVGLGDISGDRATLRVNGTQVFQSTANQGTGNYGNYKLNIGRRGNDQVTPTFPFNGRDYGIIVTGKLANATAIATTEMWLANKTSGVSL